MTCRMPFDEVQLRVHIDEFDGGWPNRRSLKLPYLSSHCLRNSVLRYEFCQMEMPTMKWCFSWSNTSRQNSVTSWGMRNDTEQTTIAVNSNTIQNGSQYCCTVKVTDEFLKSAKSATPRALKEYNKK